MGDAVVIERTSVLSKTSPKGITSTSKVIGFKTNPKGCFPDLLVLKFSLYYYLGPYTRGFLAKHGSFVWDMAEDKLETAFIDWDDTDYAAWRAKLNYINNNLFEGMTDCGKAVPTTEEKINWNPVHGTYDMSTYPAGCQTLIPGAQDYSKIWTIYAGYPSTESMGLAQATTRQSAGENQYIYPLSAYGTSQLPLANPFVTGYRLSVQYRVTEMSYLLNYNFIFPAATFSMTCSTGGLNLAQIFNNMMGAYTTKAVFNAGWLQYNYDNYYITGDKYSDVVIQTAYDVNGVTGWSGLPRNTALENYFKYAIAQTYLINTSKPVPDYELCELFLQIGMT